MGDSSKGASSGGKEKKLDTYLDSYLLLSESVSRRWNWDLGFQMV